jgi:hypothetical protein
MMVLTCRFFIKNALSTSHATRAGKTLQKSFGRLQTTDSASFCFLRLGQSGPHKRANQRMCFTAQRRALRLSRLALRAEEIIQQVESCGAVWMGIRGA